MNANYLARLALARLPRPYTDEVILHVFCEIERTPHLRHLYDGLMDDRLNPDSYTKDGLNQQIGRSVRETLNAVASDRFDVTGICELVGSATRLSGIKSDWTWD